MRRIVWIGIGASFLTAAGNAQEESVGIYTTQGSMAYNQTLRDAEQRRRVEEARRIKAIKDTMRTVNSSQFKYATAEQFLAANRPPVPPPVDPSEQARIQRENFVPDFLQGQSAAPQGGYTTPPPVDYPRVETESAEKRNFFKWLGSQKNSSEAPGQIDMVIQEAQSGVAENVSMQEATYIEPSPELPESNSGGFFGKLFGGKKAADSPVPQSFEDPVGTADQPPIDATTPTNDGGGLLEPLAFSEAPTAPISSGPAPIFVNPEMTSGTSMTVRQTTQAEVGGVRVVLYEGSTVNLLSKNGNVANIQLPDGRKGTTELNALQ